MPIKSIRLAYYLEQIMRHITTLKHKNSCRSSLRSRVEGSRNRAATNSGHTLRVYRNTVVNPSVFSTWFVSVNTNTRRTMFAASIAIIKISHAPRKQGLFSTVSIHAAGINVAKKISERPFFPEWTS